MVPFVFIRQTVGAFQFCACDPEPLLPKTQPSILTQKNGKMTQTHVATVGLGSKQSSTQGCPEVLPYKNGICITTVLVPKFRGLQSKQRDWGQYASLEFTSTPLCKMIRPLR